MLINNKAYVNNTTDYLEWEKDFSFYITNLQIKEKHNKTLTSDEKEILDLLDLVGLTALKYDYINHPRYR